MSVIDVSSSCTSYVTLELPHNIIFCSLSFSLLFICSHNTQSTHWKLPNDPDDALSKLSSLEVAGMVLAGMLAMGRGQEQEGPWEAQLALSLG